MIWSTQAEVNLSLTVLFFYEACGLIAYLVV